jgi:AcrR family transcriptional regulator
MRSRAAPAPATREAAKQETRDALIAAGAAEFGEHGLDAPSLDTICARAGFTRGAFYVHFRDRDDLLIAVVDRVLTRFQEILLPTEEAQLDLGRTIRTFVAMTAAGEGATVGTPAWQFRHTLAACARIPALRARYLALQQRGIARVAAAAAAGQRAGAVRGDLDPRTIAEVMVVLSLGVSAATEVGVAFDLRAGGAALEQLLLSARAAPRNDPRSVRARRVRRVRSRPRRLGEDRAPRGRR